MVKFPTIRRAKKVEFSDCTDFIDDDIFAERRSRARWAKALANKLAIFCACDCKECRKVWAELLKQAELDEVVR